MCKAIMRLRAKEHAISANPLARHRTRGQFVTVLEDDGYTPPPGSSTAQLIRAGEWALIAFPGVPASALAKYAQVQYDPTFIKPLGSEETPPVLYKAGWQVMLDELPAALVARLDNGEELVHGVDFTWQQIKGAFRRVHDNVRESKARL